MNIAARDFYQEVAVSIAGYLLQEVALVPGVHYRFRTATSGPRVLTLSLAINPRHAAKIQGLSEQLAMAARLDQNAHIRIGRGHKGSLCLEIPKPEDLWFNVGVHDLPRRRGLRAGVGLDGDHRPTVVDFANPLTCHALIAGSTGSGKTNCERLLVHALAYQNDPHQAGFLLIETSKQGRAWRDFAHLPHLIHPVVSTESEALRALAWACAEMDRRTREDYSRPHVFIAIDEVQVLLCHDHFVRPIRDLVSRGREFGIHCWLATQQPTVAQLGDSVIKANLNIRLIGYVKSASDAYIATGQKKSGAELLTRAGDLLLVQPKGITRMMTALLTPADVSRLPRTSDVARLDLSQYEDIDHVLDQANITHRQPDPLEPQHVAFALTDLLMSQRALNREFAIGFPKAKRVLEFAASLYQELASLGYHLTTSTVQR